MPVYVDNNRYYLPLTEIINQMNGKMTIKDGMAYIEANGNKINLDTLKNYYVSNDKQFSLKKRALVFENIVYVSLFDLQKMLNLKIDWDEANNGIGLFGNKDSLPPNKQPESGKTALMRFEDVSADQRYATSESLEKLRAIFDYCYSRSIPMHLGWVPRYIDSKNNIDNDPAETYSIHNANFIYTLDYFSDKNGLIGLHGYTHQYGNELSISGTEFSDRSNNSEKSVRERLNFAINAAKKLDIPIDFFESPHYSATPYQKRIMEQYFNIIYEYRLSYTEKNISKIKVDNRVVKYIPTPLGYVNGRYDTNHMLSKIEALKSTTLGSFFFHPSIEFDFIALKKSANGYPSYVYGDNSPLHMIINTLIKKGYVFKDINSV
ncbi:MAG TPA: DUF2334 domain-containing protein [Ruminiclostridium sp.]|nr:DUF2334 domain-containing protein [Ruminiclostridium sp.]